MTTETTVNSATQIATSPCKSGSLTKDLPTTESLTETINERDPQTRMTGSRDFLLSANKTLTAEPVSNLAQYLDQMDRLFKVLEDIGQLALDAVKETLAPFLEAETISYGLPISFAQLVMRRRELREASSEATCWSDTLLRHIVSAREQQQQAASTEQSTDLEVSTLSSNSQLQSTYQSLPEVVAATPDMISLGLPADKEKLVQEIDVQHAAVAIEPAGVECHSLHDNIPTRPGSASVPRLKIENLPERFSAEPGQLPFKYRLEDHNQLIVSSTESGVETPLKSESLAELPDRVIAGIPTTLPYQQVYNFQTSPDIHKKYIIYNGQPFNAQQQPSNHLTQHHPDVSSEGYIMASEPLAASELNKRNSPGIAEFAISNTPLAKSNNSIGIPGSVPRNGGLMQTIASQQMSQNKTEDMGGRILYSISHPPKKQKDKTTSITHDSYQFIKQHHHGHNPNFSSLNLKSDNAGGSIGTHVDQRLFHRSVSSVQSHPATILVKAVTKYQHPFQRHTSLDLAKVDPHELVTSPMSYSRASTSSQPKGERSDNCDKSKINFYHHHNIQKVAGMSAEDARQRNMSISSGRSTAGSTAVRMETINPLARRKRVGPTPVGWKPFANIQKTFGTC